MRNTSKTDNDKGTERFSAWELESYIPIPKAAEIHGVSADTFKRHFPELVVKLSTRRVGAQLKKVIALK
jgi:hypothetical protein